MTGAETSKARVIEFFKMYDAAFNAGDLRTLEMLYHPDLMVECSESTSRSARRHERRLGAELELEQLTWAHTDIVVHMLCRSSAYVTAEYSLTYRSGKRVADSRGIATHVLLKDRGQWKIRHSMIVARRLALGGVLH